MNDSFDTGAPRMATWGATGAISPTIFDGLGPARSSVAGSNRPFDVPQLLERCLGSRQLVERVLNSFETRFEPEFQVIGAELTGGDPEAVAKAAHRFKGACANAAADELAGLAAELETAALSENLERAQSVYDRLPEAWSRFQAASATFRRDARN
ncbi:MAG: Hpt domain-containing protein [Planctomycetia bacterium]|nr:Hpt domain-containing protein [Planctomycetia bacterium]